MSHVQVPFLASDIINLDGSENFSCGPDTEPNVLVLQNKLYDTHISKWVHIKLHVADQYRPSFTPGTAFKTFPDAITPDEYQAIADADEKTDTIALLERIGIARDKEQKSE